MHSIATKSPPPQGLVTFLFYYSLYYSVLRHLLYSTLPEHAVMQFMQNMGDVAQEHNLEKKIWKF